MNKILVLFGLVLSIISCTEKRTMLSDDAFFNLTEEERNDPKYATDGIVLEDEELDIQLFASEPQITNPTNMDIDDRGRVWITEGYNYRNKLNPLNSYNAKGDRIVILEDLNEDGIADTTKVFYQGEDINAALGIAVLGSKVIVSSSPYVFVFTDTNGDDVADKKEILFEGIGGVDHDHGIHAFTVGPDGMLYFNYGNEGQGMLTKNGVPVKDKQGNVIANNGKPYREGMVFKCDINGENIEVLGYNFRNAYELTVDPFGRIWQSDNDDDGNRSVRINYVMDYGNYGYKEELTGRDWKQTRTNLEDSVYQQHWHLNDPGVVPNLLQTNAGSPTGILFYEGDLLPKKYKNQLIHADAGPSIVRSYALEKEEAGFKATINNIADGASRNKNFRPSDVCVGPDGSLFIADWNDPSVGGHNLLDLNKGRIFRVSPLKTAYKFRKADYSNPDSATQALISPNKTTQFKAYQALLAMGNKAKASLNKLYKNGTSTQRARALWLLSKLDSEQLNYAIKDKDEDIRVTAVRASRELKEDFSELYLTASKDESPQVRREVALAIRYLNLPQVWQNLADTYTVDDRWYLEALGIAADGKWDSYLKNYSPLETKNWTNNQRLVEIIWRSRSAESTQLLLDIMATKQGAQKMKFIRALDFQDSPNKNKLIEKRFSSSNDEKEKIALLRSFDVDYVKNNDSFNAQVVGFVMSLKDKITLMEFAEKFNFKTANKEIERIAFNSNVDKETNLAIHSLFKNKGLDYIVKLIEKSETLEDKNSKIKRLGLIDEKPIAAYLISVFSNKKEDLSTRKIAMVAMNGFTSEKMLWDLAKVDKVDKDVLPEAITILTGTWLTDIRSLAIVKYNKDSELSAESSLSQINDLKPDLIKGKELFNTYCIACHMVNKEGIDFGPGLSNIGSKLTTESMFNAIVSPSTGISFGYEGYTLDLQDGSTAQGILVNETEDGYQMKYMGSADIVFVDRSRVKSINKMETSLMPKYPLKSQELADLIGYLNSLK